MSPYSQYDAEIERLIGGGCSPNQALDHLTAQYPELVKQAAEVLKHIQAIDRSMQYSPFHAGEVH
jgi:hypothetical protein